MEFWAEKIARNKERDKVCRQLWLDAHDLLYTFYIIELSDERLQLWGVVDEHHEVAGEETVVWVDADGAHDNFLFLWDDIGDVAHDADVVVADDA